MRLEVKICGIRDGAALQAAVDGGARSVGLVFYARSPRAIGPASAAELVRLLPTGVRAIGLFVEPDDDLLEDVVSRVPLDMLQLHGGETAGRVAEIREGFGLPVMKAIRVATAADLDAAGDYAGAADRLLFDAKPPDKVAALPGGNGLPFDWTILTGRDWPVPWMLSGGLTRDNLTDAVRVSGARAVDVSSGVEDRPGAKNPDRIRDFLEVAAGL